jgi:hypothetical protein
MAGGVVIIIISITNTFFFCRYQLYLQVKQDVLQGRLPVAFELAAELGAYVVQGKIYILFFNNYYCVSVFFLHNKWPTNSHIHSSFFMMFESSSFFKLVI